MAQALALARVWRRLGERPGWGDGRDDKGRRDLLTALGEPDPGPAPPPAWQAALAAGADLPPLLAAAAAVPAWPAPAPLAADAVLLGAALWRSASGTHGLALPLFAAPLTLLQRLAAAPPDALAATWTPTFLAAVAAAAEAGMQEFHRLRAAAARAAALPHTARARLPAAAELALRQPVLTAPDAGPRDRRQPAGGAGPARPAGSRRGAARGDRAGGVAGVRGGLNESADA